MTTKALWVYCQTQTVILKKLGSADDNFRFWFMNANVVLPRKQVFHSLYLCRLNL